MKILPALCLIFVAFTAAAQFPVSFSTTPNTNCSGVGCNYSGPTILINEIMLSPSPGDGSIWEPSCSARCAEWIELYNPDICQPIDISCYFLGNNAPDVGGSFPGGYTIPAGTVVPPRGFVVIRGQMAPAVPSNLLIQNGGRTIEIVMSSPNTCIGGGTRLWFPNAGGWFAFYDANGVAQDAVSWGNQSNIGLNPCVATVAGCSFNGQLANYNNIPANRKNMISALNAGAHLNQSLRRVPDGGPWQTSLPAPPTYGTCNGICTPAPVITCTGTATINVLGGLAPYSFIWNDSQMQTSQTATGLCAGTYCVLVKDATNTFATFCVTMENHKPQVTTSIDTTICIGNSVVISASGHSTSTFYWNQGLGAGASHTVSPTGNAQYITTVTDTADCTNQDTINIWVNPLPSLNLFTNSPVCEGDVLFISETATPGATLSWTGPNGFTSTTQVNSINNVTTAAAGVYTLTAELNGCVSSSSISADINSPPVIIAGNNGPVCQGNQLELSVNSLPGGSYQWSGPNNYFSSSQNPTVPNMAPADSGFYYVTAVDANGCASTDSTRTLLEATPVPGFTFVNQCFGQPVPFTNTSSISSGTIDVFDWDFGAGGAGSANMNPSNTYNADGFYQVELTVTSDKGCEASVIQQVQAYDYPVPDFSYTAACFNSPTDFIDQSTLATGNGIIDSWLWEFGDGGASSIGQAPSHVYSSPGPFQATLTVSSSYGCSESITLPVEVKFNPIPDFSFVSDCQDAPISFTSLSAVEPPATLASFVWDYGDGNTGTGANSSHTYFNHGLFDVKLIAISSEGCMDSITKVAAVFPKPLSDFNFSDICTYNTAEFINTSSVPLPAIITAFDWDFGDGSSGSANTDPQHSYPVPGQYNVSLISTTDNGCTHQVQKVIEVFEPPVAAFQFNDVCTDQLAVFLNNTTNPAPGLTMNYLWDFSTGVSSQQNPPGQSYSPGTYSVSLIASIPYGPNLNCSDTAHGTIEIFPLPSPDFSTTYECLGNPTDFTDLSTPAADIVTWDWDFDDSGATSPAQNPNHIYSTHGTFNATLKVTSDKGCEASITKPAIVYDVPAPDFSAPDVCEGNMTNFTDASSVAPPSAITQWDWLVSEGTSAFQFSTQNAQHLFSSIGSFNVILEVTTNHGCTNSTTKNAEVHPNPIVGFMVSTNSGCSPLCVEFTETSSIQAPGQNIHFLWDFGDGDVSLLQTPFTHCYINSSFTNIASFPVSLTVSSDKGCVSTLVEPGYIDALPNPDAAFTPNPDTAFMTSPFFEFQNYSTGGLNWYWSLGDGSTSSLESPQVNYIDTGSYSIILVAENQYGCLDTVEKAIAVLPEFTVFIPNAFSPNGDGLNEYFFPEGIGITEVELSIYNRWGERIFSGLGPNAKWDGKTHNSSIQPGVYTYEIAVRHMFQRQGDAPLKYRGKVTLLR